MKGNGKYRRSKEGEQERAKILKRWCIDMYR